MTLHDLLDFDIAKLEAISPEELEKLCQPYFHVTRPEMAKKMESSPSKKVMSKDEAEKKANIEKAKAIAKQLGIIIK